MFDLSSNDGEGKPASGLRRAFRLAEIGNDHGGVVLEEYVSVTASTGRNYFATARDGRHFFGCDPDMMFEMDGETYRDIHPLYGRHVEPAFDRNPVALEGIGSDAVTPRTETNKDGIAYVRRGCSFYIGAGDGRFVQVGAQEFYAGIGILRTPPQNQKSEI
jgi:hypothetical protein